MIHTLEVAPIEHRTLVLFAAASGDHNPIHLDVRLARSAGYDDVFAHGMLSAAYVGRLLTSIVPQESLRSLEVRFIAVTPLHVALRLTARLASVEVVEGERRASFDLEIVTSEGTTTVTGTAVVALTEPAAEAV
ncbi:MaoC/PaaZ C-terminal domain-containing protein [Streptosporangium sp. NPDC006013]|uniref:MaoC/PaaZ C-terminal domain-containing protein n=1 Tax=Streptosporangium sp. NPDC006013 TaxID=3155596 RepID=UPI0033A1140A